MNTDAGETQTSALGPEIVTGVGQTVSTVQKGTLEYFAASSSGGCPTHIQSPQVIFIVIFYMIRRKPPRFSVSKVTNGLELWSCQSATRRVST